MNTTHNPQPTKEHSMNKPILATLCLIAGVHFAFAQDASSPDLEADKANLKRTASDSHVDADLNEPDGVSLAMAEDGSYQIFARGTGIYDFDDEDDRQEAIQEATQKAKAALSKFISEQIASDESLDNLASKVKSLSKNGGVTSESVSKEQVKKTGLAIRNSSQAILTGAITLMSKRIPGRGDSGTYQVTIGVSSTTIEAAEQISNAMTDSLNLRRKVVGDGSNVGPGGATGSGAPGGGASKGASGQNNTPEVRRAKTLF